MRSIPQIRLHAGYKILTAVLMLLPFTGSAQEEKARSRTPVVVELFTSEGCSSCPPADALLARLDREQPVSAAEIIVLEEHVDYWDQQGWHDRFSSPQFTNRQNQYGPRLKFSEPYTPQMVVDGAAQFVGNDGRRALQTIATAAQTPKIALTLSPPTIAGKHVACSVSTGASQLPKAELYVAMVDPSATTQVLHGENGGRHLDHVGVVLALKRIGKLQDLSSGPLKFDLDAPSDAAAARIHLVVFAQEADQGAIRGAASVATKQ